MKCATFVLITLLSSMACFVSAALSETDDNGSSLLKNEALIAAIISAGATIVAAFISAKRSSAKGDAGKSRRFLTPRRILRLVYRAVIIFLVLNGLVHLAEC
jgi:hypothetical protein